MIHQGWRGGARLVMLFLLPVLLAGCWDVEEIPRRGVANAVFFDRGASRRIKMGVALTIPGSQVPPNVGTTQQFIKRNYNVSAEGDSAVDAWAKIQANSERDIFFGQTRAIVLSEEAARGNLPDILEFIGRIPLVPPNTNVLVAKADPAALLDLKNQANDPPGNYIDYYFRSPFKRSLAIPVDLWRVYAILDRKAGDPYLPVIAAAQQNYVITGTAVFSRTRCVAELNADETQTLALIIGTDAGYQTIPLGKNHYAAFKNIHATTRVKPERAPDGATVFTVQSKIQGVLIESFPHRTIRPSQKGRIERQGRLMFRHKIEKLLTKLQSLNSDPAQFGNAYRIAHSRQWRTMDWHQMYPLVKFKVKVRFAVKETGLFR